MQLCVWPLRQVGVLLSLFVVCLGTQPVWNTSTAAQSQPSSLSIINSAYNGEAAVAPSSIAAMFSDFKTLDNKLYVASQDPLPTELGGVSVKVNGVDARLVFTSPFQVNILVPPETGLGTAKVDVTNADQSIRSGTMTVEQYVPGLYTATNRGMGTPAGLTTFDGVNFQPVHKPDGSAREVDPGSKSRPNFLVLFGTAIRGVPAANPGDENGVAESVKVLIQGISAKVTYAGPVPGVSGVDQVNLIIPPEVAGLDIVSVRLVAGEKVSNFLTLKIAPRLPAIKFETIEPEAEIEASLTPDDQTQVGALGNGRIYYFDAYKFSAAAGANVAIKHYSVQFDAAVILYKLNRDGTLGYVASDDQTDGLDAERKESTGALLLTRLPEAGDYIIFATTAEADPEGMGNYEIELEIEDDLLQSISYGQSISGTISKSDLHSSPGDFMDAYSFTGVKGETVQIQVSSSDFDPFVILQHNNGDFVAEDDSSGGGTTAQLTAALPATGRYTILVTPFAAQKTGNYSLRLMQQGNSAISASVMNDAGLQGRFWGGNNNALNAAHFATRRVIIR